MKDPTTKLIGQVDRLEDAIEQFKKRARRREFPAIKYIVYVQFSALVSRDIRLLEELVRYGCDSLYPKLMWQDKIMIVEMMMQLKLDYKQKFFDKFAIDFILTDYTDLLIDIQLEHLVQTIAYFAS